MTIRRLRVSSAWPAVLQGDSRSPITVLIDASGAWEYMVRLAFITAATDYPRPWVAICTDPEQFEDVFRCLSLPPGEDTEHDRAAEPLLKLLGLDKNRLVAITTTNLRDAPHVAIRAQAPVYAGQSTSNEFDRWASQLEEVGVQGIERGLDDSTLFTQVTYATGETGQEQILGWDDFFSDAEWQFLSTMMPTTVVLRRNGGDVTETILLTVAQIVASADPPDC